MKDHTTYIPAAALAARREPATAPHVIPNSRLATDVNLNLNHGGNYHG
jgi:hypothetical protein